MKETVPRESFRFHQIIRDVVCAHAVKVLRDCFSLIKEAETQTELSRMQGYGWSSFSGPSSASLSQAELVVSTFCEQAHVIFIWGMRCAWFIGLLYSTLEQDQNNII